MSDYTFKKGFAETFGKGMQIGSDAAQKRLEMIAKQKEKESETIDKIRGKSLLADYVRQFDPEGAQMIDALPPEQLAQGLSAIEKRSQFQEAFKKEQQAQAEMGAEQERRGAWGVGGIQPPSESTDSTEYQQPVMSTKQIQANQTAPASQQTQPSESQSGNGIVRTEASIKTGGVTEKFQDLDAVSKEIIARERATTEGKELTDEQILNRARESGAMEAMKESYKLAQNLKGAFSGVAEYSKMMDEAMPNSSNIPVVQRIIGFWESGGAKTGFKSNPELLALQNLGPAFLRPILRGLGEGARMSDQDIERNLVILDQASLTPKERAAIVKAFIRFTTSTFDPNVRAFMLKDKNMVDTLNKFGVDMGQKKEEPKTTNIGKFTVKIKG